MSVDNVILLIVCSKIYLRDALVGSEFILASV